MYDLKLVALSWLVATLASYTALDLASRIPSSSGWVRKAWLGAAAIVMGGGIWSMHFIGMLAFQLPWMPVSYDVALTALSLALPITVSAFGFALMAQKGSANMRLLLGGAVMGIGIAAMHYTGMAAMIMGAHLSYDPVIVSLSIVIAIFASTAALWLSTKDTNAQQRLLAAPVMGVAVAGMHYTAMYGAKFMPMDDMGTPALPDIGPVPLALWIASTTVTILVFGLVAAGYDRHLVARTSHEAQALSQIFNTSHLFQAMTDPKGCVTYANATALRGMSTSLSDVVNKPIWDIPWFAGTPQVRELIRNAVRYAQEGVTQDHSLALNLPSGSHTFEISIRPVKSPAGVTESLVVEGKDVTDRIVAEEVLRHNPEDGGAWATNRRHRTRLQQPADGSAGQFGTAAQEAPR